MYYNNTYDGQGEIDINKDNSRNSRGKHGIIVR